ncbi:unnamed protein product [Amoebophrya sp. A120]|nr:unnamed protein product [Amoebophrya sp. A120]|eukprot:GSA120T00018979001.1
MFAGPGQGSIGAGGSFSFPGPPRPRAFAASCLLYTTCVKLDTQLISTVSAYDKSSQRSLRGQQQKNLYEVDGATGDATPNKQGSDETMEILQEGETSLASAVQVHVKGLEESWEEAQEALGEEAPEHNMDELKYQNAYNEWTGSWMSCRPSWMYPQYFCVHTEESYNKLKELAEKAEKAYKERCPHGPTPDANCNSLPGVPPASEYEAEPEGVHNGMVIFKGSASFPVCKLITGGGAESQISISEQAFYWKKGSVYDYASNEGSVKKKCNDKALVTAQKFCLQNGATTSGPDKGRWGTRQFGEQITSDVCDGGSDVYVAGSPEKAEFCKYKENGGASVTLFLGCVPAVPRITCESLEQSHGICDDNRMWLIAHEDGQPRNYCRGAGALNDPEGHCVDTCCTSPEDKQNNYKCKWLQDLDHNLCNDSGGFNDDDQNAITLYDRKDPGIAKISCCKDGRASNKVVAPGHPETCADLQAGKYDDKYGIKSHNWCSDGTSWRWSESKEHASVNSVIYWHIPSGERTNREPAMKYHFRQICCEKV